MQLRWRAYDLGVPRMRRRGVRAAGDGRVPSPGRPGRSARKGITSLEQAGYTPSAFVLTPADWEGVELALSSQTAIEHLSLPYDPATRRLFGVPVTTSNAQAAGVGHVLASGAVALDTDTRGVDVQWSENATADSFGKNLVFARCESRYATSVFSPLGVVRST